MSWRDNLRAASFRGATFHVQEATSEIAGRRTAMHEFPGKTEVMVEDLGGKAQEFSITGFVIGADYMRARDALIDACAKPGVGDLIHPFYGRRPVICMQCSVAESSQEGGHATFTMTFAVTAAPKYPTAVVAPGSVIVREADYLDQISVVRLTKRWDVSGPSHVADQAESDLASILRLLGWETRVKPGTVHNPDTVGNLIAAAVRSQGGSPLQRLSSTQRLFAPSRVASTPEQKNRANLKDTSRQMIVTDVVRRLPQADLETRQEAVTTRAAITQALDHEQEHMSDDDDFFQAVGNMRSSSTDYLNDRASGLAPARRVTPTSTKPALVVAYEETDDAANAEKIIARNALPHPGFVGGGEPVEVIHG
ncbi:MAG: DNA circularization N-terminal domain-containing protein [Pseudomonadota bacterium]